MSLRILIVDDEQIVRRVLGDFLKPDGYEVIEARNGKEAVKRAAETVIHLVITDLFMPEQEGIETIRQLKQQSPDLKILAMSGAFGGEFLEMVTYLGALATIRKPLRYQEVMEVVRRLLPLPPASTEAPGPATGAAGDSY